MLKYMKRTKDKFLIYGGGELILEGYNEPSFQSDDDDPKSQSSLIFKLNGGVVASKSSKKATIADSTTEDEYIVALEAAKEVVWMKNYIQELGVVHSIAEPVVIFCDNNREIAQAKEPRSHHRSKHILRRYHILREMVRKCGVSTENTVKSEIVRIGHHQPCPVQYKYVVRTVNFKKRIYPRPKRDRGISYAVGDASILYETVATVISGIEKEVPMSSNLADPNLNIKA
ncbi:UNVERIFIED_CONTAM: Retrovirus-related Pol polyprotein from transposon TNT 1-94 [Sesamum calycinum]|uniref:Retrovirus-related Pol polyprotein from transposon TNT 1-94 n=1 Tax=Sesamum calycinum TaxID=2727403 RepID=A0AAW2K8Z0_9LAMI